MTPESFDGEASLGIDEVSIGSTDARKFCCQLYLIGRFNDKSGVGITEIKYKIIAAQQPPIPTQWLP